MKNLQELVSIKSNENEEEIIKYLQTKLTGEVEEIKIIKNEQDNKKSILVGVNTKLEGVCPHCAFRTH